MHKIKYIFPEKKVCVHTLPKIFRLVPQNALIISFGLRDSFIKSMYINDSLPNLGVFFWRPVSGKTMVLVVN